MITILNTSIITAHGSYTYKACSLGQAKQLVAGGYQSAIGHESTAAVISTLLSVEIKMNRIQYQQQPGETALVFKLRGRAPEGRILTAEEIEEIGYEWGILVRYNEPVNLLASEEEIRPSRGKRVWWWMRNKYWWFIDHIIMPLICFILAVGFAAAAATGLETLLSTFVGS